MRLLCLFIVHIIFSYTNGLKCMRPSDARLFTTVTAPQLWHDHGWHTGLHLATDSSGVGKGVVFTRQGSPIWWLLNREQTAHFIVTGNEQKILCAQLNEGLKVNWFDNTAENRDQDWCQWRIEEQPNDPSFFKMKNIALIEEMPEIGYVYFGETGLYFDYDFNAKNDARNQITEAEKTFRWTKANPSQVEFLQLPDECEIGPSGYPSFFMRESDDDVTMRGATGRRKRRVKDLVFKNKFATCSPGWYLNQNKCYRIFRYSNINFDRNNRLCTFFKGTAVVPMNKNEQKFLSRLISHYSRSDPTATYWLGMKRLSLNNPIYYDLNRNRLKFRRWGKAKSTFENDLCSYWKKKRWYSGSCIANHKALCVAPAEIKKRESCGKIQLPSVDSIMLSESRYGGRDDGRIVGGKTATDGQFPWQVSFRFKRPVRQRGLVIYHNCGGTLIDNCWVLTAAHCFPERDPRKFKVRLGDFNNEIDEGIEQEFDIETLIIHPEYTFIPSARNDIALVRLKSVGGRCAKLNDNIQPACLPDRTFPIQEEDELCQVSGWGVTNTSIGQASASANLQWVTLPTLTNEYCKLKYNKERRHSNNEPLEIFVDDIMLCAGMRTGGKDACTGDSGGPFVCRNQKGRYGIVGIVSFGIGCARAKYPGVYTNVRHYLPWISAKINANGGGNFVRTS